MVEIHLEDKDGADVVGVEFPKANADPEQLPEGVEQPGHAGAHAFRHSDGGVHVLERMKLSSGSRSAAEVEVNDAHLVLV